MMLLIDIWFTISEAYADDTQFYIEFKSKESTTEHTIDIMKRYIQDVRSWMLNNYLMINDTKTEIIFLGSKKIISTQAILV